MHLIHITLRGLHSATSPRTAGAFIFSEEHQVHLLHGHPLTAAEFNAFAESREWERLIGLHGGLLQIRMKPAPVVLERAKNNSVNHSKAKEAA